MNFPYAGKMMGPEFAIFQLLLISTMASPLSSTSSSNSSSNDQLLTGNALLRLPNNTAPKLYILNFELDIDDEVFTFNGTSSTVFDVLSPTSSITLHGTRMIDIDNTYTSLVHSNGIIEKPLSHSYKRDLQFISIRFSKILTIGEYTLNLKWTGCNIDNPSGLYRLTGEDIAGKRQYVVTTLFEPIGARNAFPCWDEPALKAQFQISLKHPRNYTATSNMPITYQTSAEDGKIWTRFRRSPSMSTYLMTFVVADYASSTNEHGNVTIWTNPKDVNSTATILEITSKIVSAMEAYTGIAYSLPKLDGVVLDPYVPGAMEHWGLISYGKKQLHNPKIDSLAHRILAARVITHEVIHQWFGNLVTPLWWNDIWLSEAITYYLEDYLLDTIQPDWHLIDFTVVGYLDSSPFQIEQTEEVIRPLRWMPTTQEDISDLMSWTVYIKGAAIVKMLHHMIGKEAFRDGLAKYLTKYQFRTVVSDNLWECLQESYDEKELLPRMDIKQIMDPWLDQTGFPILSVKRDRDTGLVTIRQSDSLDSESDRLWTIPINFATTSQPDFSSTRPTHLMQGKFIILHSIKKHDWILLNIQHTESEDPLVRKIRMEILPFACHLGHEGCKTAAAVYFEEILAGKRSESFIKNNAQWILPTALKNANDTIWEKALASNLIAERKYNPFIFLGISNNRTLTLKYFALAVERSKNVLSEDLYTALISMAMGLPENYNFGLDYLIYNVDNISKKDLKQKYRKDQLEIICEMFSSMATTAAHYTKLTRLLHKLEKAGTLFGVEAILHLAKQSWHCTSEISTKLDKFRALFDSGNIPFVEFFRYALHLVEF